jgi:hypothetical protein
MSRKDLLYGEDYCRDAIVVTEGPTDAWRIGPGAVATFGLAYSRAQVLRISRYPLRVICFDSEPEAQRQARRMRDELTAFPGETVIVRLDSKDAASAKPKEVRQLREFLENG